MKPPPQHIVATNHRAVAETVTRLPRYLLEKRVDVLLLSPHLDDVRLVRTLFPLARLHASRAEFWNLYRPFPVRGAKFDLIIASNVFHYSSDPALWFNHVLDVTDWLLVQDLIARRRSRSSGSGLGHDGDTMRYMYSRRGVYSDYIGAYDLSALDDRMVYFTEYKGGVNEFHYSPENTPRHFCAILRNRTKKRVFESPGGRTAWARLIACWKFRLLLWAIIARGVASGMLN